MLHATHDKVSRRRRFAVLFSAVMLFFAAIPIVQNFRDRPDDGFPLSYYPMFSSERDGTTTLSHAIGFRQDGSVLNLHYKLAGRGGMNQVRRQMRALVRDGEAAELCRDVAEKVADSKLNKHSSITEVAIVRDVYQFEEFFSGELAPAKREELARCTVRR